MWFLIRQTAESRDNDSCQVRLEWSSEAPLWGESGVLLCGQEATLCDRWVRGVLVDATNAPSSRGFSSPVLLTAICMSPDLRRNTLRRMQSLPIPLPQTRKVAAVETSELELETRASHSDRCQATVPREKRTGLPSDRSNVSKAAIKIASTTNMETPKVTPLKLCSYHTFLLSPLLRARCSVGDQDHASLMRQKCVLHVRGKISVWQR